MSCLDIAAARVVDEALVRRGGGAPGRSEPSDPRGVMERARLFEPHVCPIAAPSPRFHSGALGVEVDVPNGLEDVRLMANHVGPEPALEEMPGKAVSPVEVLRVVATQVLHSARDRPGWDGEDEMEVIRHQAPSEHPPVERAAHTLEQLEEALAVGVVRKDGLSAIAAAHDVADASRLVSWRTWHAASVRPQPSRNARNNPKSRGQRPATHQSGCPDSNWGPLRPERSALPGCATPRERAIG